MVTVMQEPDRDRHGVLHRFARDRRRRDDLDRIRRERISAEGRLRCLLEMVEEGLMDPRDAIFAERVAEKRRSIAALAETERSLESQLGSKAHRIDDEAIARFGATLRAQLLGENSDLRRA